MNLLGRSSICDSLVKHLTTLIAEGKLVPGDKLPPQDELAQEMGVSRTSLREALKELCSIGLIEMKQGKGTFVKDPEVTAFVNPMLSILYLSRGDMLDLLEARKCLEVGIAGLAALRSSPEDLAGIERTVVSMNEALREGDIERFTRLDLEFHLLLGRASKNRVLVRLVDTLQELLSGQIKQVHRFSESPVRASRLHMKILSAIRAKDPAEAQKAMTQHLDDAREFALKAVVNTTPEHRNQGPNCDGSSECHQQGQDVYNVPGLRPRVDSKGGPKMETST